MHESPDLSTFYALHEAMRRSADRFAAALDVLRPEETARLRALDRWYDGFARELEKHHRIEDTIFFPALLARIPAFDEVNETLAAGHHHLDDVIAGIRRGMSALVNGEPFERWHPETLSYAVELSRFLHEHLGLEDQDVLPLASRHFSAEEWEALDQAAMKATGLRQMLVTVPWLMTMGEPEACRRILVDAPGALKLIWALTRGSYGRLVARAFPEQAEVLV